MSGYTAPQKKKVPQMSAMTGVSEQNTLTASQPQEDLTMTSVKNASTTPYVSIRQAQMQRNMQNTKQASVSSVGSDSNIFGGLQSTISQVANPSVDISSQLNKMNSGNMNLTEKNYLDTVQVGENVRHNAEQADKAHNQALGIKNEIQTYRDTKQTMKRGSEDYTMYMRNAQAQLSQMKLQNTQQIHNMSFARDSLGFGASVQANNAVNDIISQASILMDIHQDEMDQAVQRQTEDFAGRMMELQGHMNRSVSQATQQVLAHQSQLQLTGKLVTASDYVHATQQMKDMWNEIYTKSVTPQIEMYRAMVDQYRWGVQNTRQEQQMRASFNQEMSAQVGYAVNSLGEKILGRDGKPIPYDPNMPPPMMNTDGSMTIWKKDEYGNMYKDIQQVDTYRDGQYSANENIRKPTRAKTISSGLDQNGIFKINVPEGFEKRYSSRGFYECGMFVNDVTGIGVGDTLANKREFINRSQPQAGYAFVENTGGQYGHIGMIESVDADGTLHIVESNYPEGTGVSRKTIKPGDARYKRIEGYIDSGLVQNKKTQSDQQGITITPEAQGYIDQIKNGNITLEKVMSNLGSSEAAQALKSQIISGTKDMKNTKAMAGISGLQDQLKKLQILKEHSGLDNAVGPNSLVRVGDPLTGTKSQFIADTLNIINSGVLQQLIDAKAGGATFGALSDAELRLLQTSANAISGLVVTDGDGKVVGFKTTEKDFKKRLDEMILKTQEALKKAGAASEQSDNEGGSQSLATPSGVTYTIE